MYMRDVWASLGRRWILLLLCLLATAGLAWGVSQRVSPTYESQADVVLLPPKSVVDPTANRYLDLGGLRQAVDVLTRSLMSDETVDEVGAAAPGGTYEVVPDGTTSAPILIVTVEASSAAGAQDVLDEVLRLVPVNLGRLQQSLDISDRSMITRQLVSQDVEPNAVVKKQVRAVGAVTALALFVSAVLIGVIDHRLLRRAADRQAAEQDLPAPAPTSLPQPVPSPPSQHGTEMHDVVATKVGR